MKIHKPTVLVLMALAIGMMTLDQILLQCDGRRIQLLPACPKDWTADFTLFISCLKLTK